MRFSANGGPATGEWRALATTGNPAIQSQAGGTRGLAATSQSIASPPPAFTSCNASVLSGVAQICNLPYRRIAFGGASSRKRVRFVRRRADFKSTISQRGGAATKGTQPSGCRGLALPRRSSLKAAFLSLGKNLRRMRRSREIALQSATLRYEFGTSSPTMTEALLPSWPSPCKP